MPKLAEKQQQTRLSFFYQLGWSLCDLQHGMLPYFPLRPRTDGLIHAAFHWTQFPRWLRAITRK